MRTDITPLGRMRMQENGASHLGRIRSEASRQKMREAARGRPRTDQTPTPRPKIEHAMREIYRGATQRQAARTAGVSIGAIQRHLRSLRTMA